MSVASLWEIEIKRKLGKLTAPEQTLDLLRRSRFDVLPIAPEHAVAAGRLPLHHNDPFDRMLVAQAQTEDLVLVTADERLRAYDVPILDARPGG